MPQRQRVGVVLGNHYQELLRFLSARFGDRHAAVDIAHDAYLRVLERSSQAQIEHPKAFLYRAVLSPAVDEYRRNRVRRAESLKVLSDKKGLASPSSQMMVNQGQCLGNLQHALVELLVVCRNSLPLRKLDGLSHSQIAEYLNISRSLMEKHIVNTMKHCRARMCEQEAD